MKDQEILGMEWIPMELKEMKKDSFKILMKKKIKEFTYRELMLKKMKSTKSKNIHYKSLNIQSYFTFEDVTDEGITKVFQYRTHMLPFDGNVKSHTETTKVCPLCESHPDSQDSMEDCDELKKHHQNIQKIKNLYDEMYNKEIIDLLCKVLKTRQTLIENSQIRQQQS